jgi:hypothetical protein
LLPTLRSVDTHIFEEIGPNPTCIFFLYADFQEGATADVFPQIRKLKMMSHDAVYFERLLFPSSPMSFNSSSVLPSATSSLPHDGTSDGVGAGNGSGAGGVGNGTSGLIGSGLVEITALTALIGSPTAEQLALGDRGAAGLSWVGMSTFGAVSILKSCVAASTPTWLRETLGVRNAATDGAIGLGLDLASKYLDREDMARKSMKNAVGVTCESRKRVSDNRSKGYRTVPTLSFFFLPFP